jgi:hypothetical protein
MRGRLLFRAVADAISGGWSRPVAETPARGFGPSIAERTCCRVCDSIRSPRPTPSASTLHTLLSCRSEASKIFWGRVNRELWFRQRLKEAASKAGFSVLDWKCCNSRLERHATRFDHRHHNLYHCQSLESPWRRTHSRVHRSEFENHVRKQ